MRSNICTLVDKVMRSHIRADARLQVYRIDMAQCTRWYPAILAVSNHMHAIVAVIESQKMTASMLAKDAWDIHHATSLAAKDILCSRFRWGYKAVKHQDKAFGCLLQHTLI